MPPFNKLSRNGQLIVLAVDGASTPRQIAERSGVSIAVVYTYLQRLVSRGVLERTCLGNYTLASGYEDVIRLHRALRS